MPRIPEEKPDAPTPNNGVAFDDQGRPYLAGGPTPDEQAEALFEQYPGYDDTVIQETVTDVVRVEDVVAPLSIAEEGMKSIDATRDAVARGEAVYLDRHPWRSRYSHSIHADM